MDKDITNLVEYGNVDDECLPLVKCACGEMFHSWSVVLSIYRDDPYTCKKCGRRLYFSNRITVYEISE